ncbi:hypothetical protein EGR_01204 [Echinococcus granulosus]|uniref:Uncharacterized protein n=1 Tax=Echinococcus granulosus TaxID=6210 RepID=W6UTU4_ECHGR|nr:hypothetical protein EGR_01204 [Echinococcus granulosus]EUB64076.1 hypothetical protein EGR_01204 [Echinococcus granulosus]
MYQCGVERLLGVLASPELLIPKGELHLPNDCAASAAATTAVISLVHSHACPLPLSTPSHVFFPELPPALTAVLPIIADVVNKLQQPVINTAHRPVKRYISLLLSEYVRPLQLFITLPPTFWPPDWLAGMSH